MPLLRPGFRRVVFAIAIMAVVLFYQRGIMGENEFSLAGIAKFFKTLPSRFNKRGKNLSGKKTEAEVQK